LKAQTLKQVEYFIDKDKGVGKNTKLNLASSVDSSYQINIDVSGLSAGFHKLYFRAKDNKGKWGLTAVRNIEVTASFDQPEITAGEYFFDTDPGHGKGTEISVSGSDSAVTKSFSATVSFLDIGYHKLYIRFKDDAGNWSITSRRNVEIIKTADTIKIVAAEYFLASDKGYGKAFKKIFTDSVVNGKFKIKIPYKRIPADGDTLFVRVRDSLGNWSLTKLDTFKVESFAKTLVASSEENISINNDAKTFTIFPNPANQFININFKSKKKSAMLQIFDVNGKRVLQTIVTPEISNRINVSKLGSGSYLAEINDGETKQTAKFIKQ
jgi:hypothetical protein